MYHVLPQFRGYQPLYHPGDHCPACGGANWIVGRSSAECAVCTTALPLAPVRGVPAPASNPPAWATRP